MFIFASFLAFAADVVIDVRSIAGQKGKSAVVPAIIAPVTVKDKITLDISPYPRIFESDRYLVEYFLNDQMIYSGNGTVLDSSSGFSFQYLFDTSVFSNGEYKLIVNLWDKKSPMAIGIKKIVIKNDEK